MATESMLRTGDCAAGVSNVRAVRNTAEDATIDQGQTSRPTSRLLQSSVVRLLVGSRDARPHYFGALKMLPPAIQ